MVRNIWAAWSRSAAGAGRPDWMAEVLAARSRDAARPTFPPDGLYFLGPYYDAAMASRPTRRRWTGLALNEHRTRIKICGLTREADVDDAVDAGADALGFVLYAKSPRHVGWTAPPNWPRGCRPSSRRCCCSSTPRPARCSARPSGLPQALLQFHGDETPEQCLAAGRPYLRARAWRRASIC
jgi:hypothetical protein